MVKTMKKVKDKKQQKHQKVFLLFWRSGWDSNPRPSRGIVISSHVRYDHFDTAPNMKLLYCKAATNLTKPKFWANSWAKQARIS